MQMNTKGAKASQIEGSNTARSARVGVALLIGVVIPLLGYASLLGAHDHGETPKWVYAAIPAALIGPDVPSPAAFFSLAFVNVVLWSLIGYWVLKGMGWCLRT